MKIPLHNLIPWVLGFVFIFGAEVQPAEKGNAALDPLIELLSQTDDTAFQVDILRGIRAALEGRRQADMPKGWRTIELELGASSNVEVQSLVQSLGILFGSDQARARLRQTLADRSASPTDRAEALKALTAVKDPNLPVALMSLLDEPILRQEAIRSLAGYDDDRIPPAILAVYFSLNTDEQRDALNSLASRVGYARALLNAVEGGVVSTRHLTAGLVRQLHHLDDSEISQQVEKVWGAFREIGTDKKALIQQYKDIYFNRGKADPEAGRAVFLRSCQQCHMLFGMGGRIGPDLTGSNRRDLDYILQNVVDPNAVIPNDYRTTVVETTDGRVLSGIVMARDEQKLVLQTLTEVLPVPAGEVKSIQQSPLSMMPENLLLPLKEPEVRDLIAYLGQARQLPLRASAENLHMFFDGNSLQNWSGNPEWWRVEKGEIVGSASKGLDRNEFLISQMHFGDFRLICEVRLVGDKGNSGIQFRSQPEGNGSVKGYQADIGPKWWGKLYEEHGRKLLWKKSGEPFVKPDQWNTYEILATGSQIRTAINGHPCVDLDDPEGASGGVLALQLHSGDPTEVRFRKFQIELDPKPGLKTKPD